MDVMIKVLPGSYFESKEENKEINQYIKQFEDRVPDNVFDLYFKEKWRSKYVPGELWSSDPGYFVFENEKDATLFALRWAR
jgi:hypothetical protein